MSDATESHAKPLLIKYMTPTEVEAHQSRDPRLLVPVGTTEHHGPHLPLGCDTLIVERLADQLSAAFQVLRAPTVEYGVNAPTPWASAGSATVRGKTLHRFLNDLIGVWEAGGIEQFIILTAHGHDPHQEALSTLRTRRARVRTVDIFAAQLHDREGQLMPIHGGEVDTSLMLYLDDALVDMTRAQDYLPPSRLLRGYQHSGVSRALPADSPGSFGRPSRASREKGEQWYQLVYDRIATRVFQASTAGDAAAILE